MAHDLAAAVSMQNLKRAVIKAAHRLTGKVGSTTYNNCVSQLNSQIAFGGLRLQGAGRVCSVAQVGSLLPSPMH